MSATAREIVWDEAACSRGHAAAREILERVGVEVRDEAGLTLFGKAGARVEHTRVRLPGEMIDEALATAPREFWLRGRDGDGTLDLEIRDGPVYFGSGSDCPYILDPRTGERRRARVADIEAGAALTERHLPNIDFVMSMWLPEDAPQDVIELVQLAAMLTYTRKPIVVSSARGGDAMREQVEMAAVCDGADSLACLTMSAPSLILDGACVEKTLSCAELKVPMVLETGISLGSTGPVSLQTAVAVAHAEILAVLVLHQLANPGAPYIAASGLSQLDMSTLVDCYSAPESGLASVLQCELAKHLSLPTFEYAGYSDSKTLDEQWAAEIMASTMWAHAVGGTLQHDVGYLESGLVCAHEALVMGDEVAGHARAIYRLEVPADETAFLIDEVAEVGPGGSYLGRTSTRRGFREWWRPANPSLFDRSNYRQWQENGALSLGDRLGARTRELLADPPVPVVEPGAIDQFAALIEQARTRLADGG
jgi:trimethylamine---corrinoid protein Co-methyltransferase